MMVPELKFHGQPYSSPTAIKTTKRCQFGLPGRKYDCRCVGKYQLNGKRYCAPHYDLAWKVTNPIYGTQHDYQNRPLISKPGEQLLCCVLCGSVKPYDGLPQSVCPGRVRIVLRTEMIEVSTCGLFGLPTSVFKEYVPGLTEIVHE